MLTLSIANKNLSPFVTIITYEDEEDQMEIMKGATRDDGSFCKKTAKKIAVARARRRLAAQGAEQVPFFPVS